MRTKSAGTESLAPMSPPVKSQTGPRAAVSLDQSLMPVFGFSPLEEPLHTESCPSCRQPVLAARAEAHYIECVQAIAARKAKITQAVHLSRKHQAARNRLELLRASTTGGARSPPRKKSSKAGAAGAKGRGNSSRPVPSPGPGAVYGSKIKGKGASPRKGPGKDAHGLAQVPAGAKRKASEPLVDKARVTIARDSSLENEAKYAPWSQCVVVVQQRSPD